MTKSSKHQRIKIEGLKKEIKFVQEMTYKWLVTYQLNKKRAHRKSEAIGLVLMFANYILLDASLKKSSLQIRLT